MRVLYDHQAFLRTKYGGIPRYFNMLLSQLKQDSNMGIIYPHAYCRNIDFRQNFLESPDRFLWRVNDYIVDKTVQRFHENPARYLSKAYQESATLLDAGKFDLFHPTFFEPYFLSHLHGKPYVLTIHDLSLELYPELGALSNRTPNETKQVIQNASRFIADSVFTKKHFVEYYDIDSELVDVVYLGPTFSKIEQVNHDESTLSERPYLLYVNIRAGRKNFYTMVNIIKDILIQENLNLICGGGGSFTDEEMDFFRVCGIADRVRYVNADDTKLKELYLHALAFVFPSIYEGFGLPILEAFACGCPVILSNATCLPEVGGDAAVYFDPKEPKSMKDAIWKVISDEKLREKMRGMGYKQYMLFSWEKCADETKNIYEKIICKP